MFVITHFYTQTLDMMTISEQSRVTGDEKVHRNILKKSYFSVCFAVKGTRLSNDSSNSVSDKEQSERFQQICTSFYFVKNPAEIFMIYQKKTLLKPFMKSNFF